MSIQIGRYSFEGPFTSASMLRNSSGVYVILGDQAGTTYVADVGESKEVQTRVENHDRKPCWERQGYSQIRFAAFYTNEPERMQMEQELRAKYTPPCGDR